MFGFLTQCLSVLFLVRLFIWDIPDKLTAGQLTNSMEQGPTWEEHKRTACHEILWRSVSSALRHQVVGQKLTDGSVSANFYHTTRHYITQDSNLHRYCQKNIRCHPQQNQKTVQSIYRYWVNEHTGVELV